MISIQALGSSSAGNAYIIRSGDRILLLECGVPWQVIQRAVDYRLDKIDGCLCSHGHGDHSKSAKHVMASGVDLYASPDALPQFAGTHHRFKALVAMESVKVGPGWTVQPFHTVHDSPGSLGFVVSDGEDTLAFVTDTGYCRYKVPGLSLLMIEANFSEVILQQNIERGHVHPAVGKRVRENHMSIERVLDFLAANDLSRLREIRLIHLSDGNSDAELFQKMVQQATGVPTMIEEA